MRCARHAATRALLAALFTFAGCSSAPETKTETKPESKATTDDKAKEEVRAKSAEVFERLRVLKGKVGNLPDRTAYQLAEKDKLIRLIAQVQNDSARKDALSATLPEDAMRRMTQTLDQIEAGIRNFPQK
jgi:PBP1b-binding outer membrane lipoprotein LpoB